MAIAIRLFPYAMSNLKNTIEGLASQFAASVIEALRGVSIEELYAVTSGGGGARRGRPRADAGGRKVAPVARGRGGRLGRRSAAQIGKMIDSIVEAVAKSASGLRAEQIRDQLGVEAKELPRPLAEALSSGRITKSGQKRATTYFAGSGGGGGGGATAKGRGRKGRGRAKKRG